MNWIIEHLPAWNSWIALVTYWLPMALCAFGYTMRTVYKTKHDLNERAEAPKRQYGTYIPSVTIGTLVGYVLLTVTPIANLFAAIFDVAPIVFRVFFEWCARVLDVPLVPKRKDQQ